MVALSQSLAVALARLAGSSSLTGVASKSPKLSKIFANPRAYDGSRGKKFKEWWTHVHAWQNENATILTGATSSHTILSRMVGRDTGTFAHAELNEIIGGKQWTWVEFTDLMEGNFQSTNKKDWSQKAL